MSVSFDSCVCGDCDSNSGLRIGALAASYCGDYVRVMVFLLGTYVCRVAYQERFY
mgnify:CR=1 FL=1